jgi:hypothetical protein
MSTISESIARQIVKSGSNKLRKNQPIKAQVRFHTDSDLKGKVAKRDDDIYAAMDDVTLKESQPFPDYVSVLSYGWASPLPKEGEELVAPLEHPEAMRVVLGLVMNTSDDSSVSALSIVAKRKAGSLLMDWSATAYPDELIIASDHDAHGVILNALRLTVERLRNTAKVN